MNAIPTASTEPPAKNSGIRSGPGVPHAEKARNHTWFSRRAWLAFFAMLAVLGGFVISHERPVGVRVEAESVAPYRSPSGPVTQGPGPVNIVDLQPYRQTSSARVRSDDGAEGTATLVNLNPAVNAWYLLEISWNNGTANSSYHLENARPRNQKLALDGRYPSGIVILEGTSRFPCDLLAGGSTNALERARASPLAYASLCAGRIFLRNPVKGHRTTLEAATDFLREQVWGGEKVIVLFHHLLEDRNRETGELRASSPAAAEAAVGGAPLAAAMEPKYAGQFITAPNLEIPVQLSHPAGLRPGVWYAAQGTPGIYLSILRPDFVSAELLQSHRSQVNSLDAVEASALCYLVAFDLDQFDLGFALGTEHPAVGWSDHILAQVRDSGLPGPDGIGGIAPLVSTGLVKPQDARATVAVFTAGFKRSHGAFKSGELALKNHGTHYGFLEDGVVFSKLQPGLSTIYVRTDGSVGMKTWEDADNKLLPELRYARQNGVPLIEFDAATQAGVPGPLVNRWGPGNWSGSEDAKLRTMRSGLALQQNGGRRFLIYAVFTTATPAAMVRVFQAYQCRYAMLLDMNALEHTYLAVYQRMDSQLVVEHLISGMGEVDQTGPAGPIPRFLGFPDNRDFFYVMRRGR